MSDAREQSPAGEARPIDGGAGDGKAVAAHRAAPADVLGDVPGDAERGIQRHDVIVLGGGPAGAVAAWQWARRGRDVLVIERRSESSPKCCGHCLHPAALAHLDAMGCGVAVRAAARGRTRRGLLIVRGDRVAVERRFDEGGIVVSRRTLDPLLRLAGADAGADVRCSAAARIVRLDGEGAVVEVVEGPTSREWHAAPLIIGADGIGSAVARAAGLVDREAVGRKFGFSMSLPARSPGPSELDQSIAMFVERDGYLGAVREGGDRLHCAALIASTARIPTKPLDVVEWFVGRSSLLAAALAEGWRDDLRDVVATGPLPWRTTARTTPSVALVGDAAGYVEPFTGEGMRWAIESAWLLGEAIEGGPWDESARARYELAWRESIGAMHRRCALVATIVESPNLIGALGGMVGAARRVWPAFSDVALGPFLRRLVPR